MFAMTVELLHTVYVIVHILGAVVGAGAALSSDVIFLAAIRDGIIKKDELSILKDASKVVWLGLLLVVLSGVGLFSLNFEALLVSSKFQLKMLLVLAIIVNGLIFARVHTPYMEARLGKKLFPKSKKNGEGDRTFLALSGVISATSWLMVVILGSVSSIPIGFVFALGLQLGFVALASAIALSTLENIINEAEKTALTGAFIMTVIAAISLVFVG